MSKGLEALNELKYKGFYYSKDSIDISTFVQMRLDIIETELKRLEELEKGFKTLEKKIVRYKKHIDKDNEILRIIKEKMVNLEYLKCCETYEQYKTICSYWNEITQEEYDLLREVLL